MPFLPSQFHFIYPHWLWLLLLLPLLMGVFFWQQRHRDGFQKLVDPALLPHLLHGQPSRSLALPGSLLVAGLLAILALAGPTWEQQPQLAGETQKPLVIAVSLSNTMYANDVKPSRIAQARFKAHDLLNANADGNTALVAFAGAAFTVAPLTRDSRSLTRLLDGLSPAVMPVDGNNVGAAIRRSVTLIQQAGNAHGTILIIASNADSDAIAQARKARQAGMRLMVLGIGQSQPVPVTLPNGTLLQRASGETRLTRRDDTSLRQLAHAGGGHYRTASDDNSDIQQLLQAQLDASDADADTQQLATTAWVNRGPWLLLPLVLLFALFFRQGWLLILIIVPFSLPQPAQASSWQQRWEALWLRPDQQAAQALQKQQPERAEQVAKDPDWKGAGAYEAGHYDVAIDAYRQSTHPAANYNLGNALAKAGQLPAAVDAYEKALKQDPDNDDARYNLEQVKKALEQQQNQQQQEGQKDQQNQQQDQQNQQDQQQNGEKDAASTEKQPADPKSDGGDNHGDEQAAQQSASEHNNTDAAQPNKPDEGDESNDAHQNAATQADNAQQQQDTAAARQALSKELDDAMQQDDAHDLGQITAPAGDHKPLPADIKHLLERVPDEPGSLLKRKFYLEYQQHPSGDH